MKDITKSGADALTEIVFETGLKDYILEPDLFDTLEKLYKFTDAQERVLKFDIHTVREQEIDKLVKQGFIRRVK